VFLKGIDQELIDEHNITFKWWRIVGEEEPILVKESNQPWVLLELDPNHKVVYKVEILIPGQSSLLLTHPPFSPLPTSRFWKDFITWSIPGIFLIAIMVSVTICFIERKTRRKKNPEKIALHQ